MATYNFTQTGAEIQAILDRVEANTGATYMGVATPSTDTSGITTQKVFYLAGQAGTYTNMGGSTHSSGIGVFVYNGSAWSYQNVPSSAVVAADATPTERGTNAFSNGGAWNLALELKGVSGKKITDSFFVKDGGSLTTTGNWYQPAVYNHICIPLSAGTKVSVKAYSATGTQFQYGWLTDAYVPPTSATAIPYVSGTSRVLADINVQTDLTAPSGAAYLCLTTKDGAGAVFTYDINITESTPLSATIKALGESDRKNDYIRSLFGFRGAMTLTSFVNKYIASNGTLVNSTAVMTTNDYIEVSGDMAEVNVDYDALATVIPDVSYLKVMVYCYDAAKGNLGRTAQDYQQIRTIYTPQYVYLPNTKYIRISFAARGTTGSSDMTINTYLDAVNASRNSIFKFYDVIRGESGLIRQYPYDLYTHPINGKLNLYTHYGLQQSASASTAGQSNEYYNGYLFQNCPDGVIKLYSFSGADATYVSTLNYTSTNHGNAAQFYPTEVESGFPYMYLSDLGSIEVLNISTSAVSVAQTITFNITGSNTTTRAVCGIAGDDGYIWAAYPTSSNGMKFLKFALPEVSQGNVTLGDSDILDSWEIANVPQTDYVRQGQKVYNGKFYQVYGGTNGHRGIWIFDTATHSMIADIKLDDYFRAEFEDIFIFNGNMYLFVVSAPQFYEIVLQ